VAAGRREFSPRLVEVAAKNNLTVRRRELDHELTAEPSGDRPRFDLYK
jgi:hypothetical protein